MFGLCFTLTLGLLLVITSYLLEPISGLLYRRKGYKKHAHIDWITTTTLQLQRLAHEEIGMGTWSKCLDTVPTTKPGDHLACLDILDPDHPVLRPALNTKHRALPISSLPSKSEKHTMNPESLEISPRSTFSSENTSMGGHENFGPTEVQLIVNPNPREISGTKVHTVVSGTEDILPTAVEYNSVNMNGIDGRGSADRASCHDTGGRGSLSESTGHQEAGNSGCGSQKQ